MLFFHAEAAAADGSKDCKVEVTETATEPGDDLEVRCDDGHEFSTGLAADIEVQQSWSAQICSSFCFKVY